MLYASITATRNAKRVPRILQLEKNQYWYIQFLTPLAQT
jgi:hypothetical protein